MIKAEHVISMATYLTAVCDNCGVESKQFCESYLDFANMRELAKEKKESVHSATYGFKVAGWKITRSTTLCAACNFGISAEEAKVFEGRFLKKRHIGDELEKKYGYKFENDEDVS